MNNLPLYTIVWINYHIHGAEVIQKIYIYICVFIYIYIYVCVCVCVCILIFIREKQAKLIYTEKGRTVNTPGKCNIRKRGQGKLLDNGKIYFLV